MVKCVFLLLLGCFFIAKLDCNKLEERFLWEEIDYDWPSPEYKQKAIESKKYIEANNLPLGLDVWKNKLFITVPRWKAGVASSLNYVDLSDENNRSPIFHPYPSWKDNELPEDAVAGSSEYGGGRADAKAATKSGNILEKNNASIISTFRVRVDECDRLWVMDSGLSDVLGNPKQLAKNSIAIFDLNTDKLIARHEFPEGHIKENSFFANIIVDTSKDRCDDAFAYMPDLGSYQLVVYSLKQDKSWCVKHNFFHFDPLAGDFNVAGINFQWTDGIFGIALGKPTNDQGDRTVYFHPFASTKEFSVSNTVLKNESYVTSPSSYYAFKLLGERGMNSQSTAEFYDESTDVIFYTQINRDAVGCWNIKKEYTPANQGIVDSDSVSLVFPNDLKVDRTGKLWVLSDKLPIFIYGTWKRDKNYRILTGNTKDIIKGTPCEN